MSNPLYFEIQGQLALCDRAMKLATNDREKRTIAATVSQLAIVGSVLAEETDPNVLIGVIVVHERISAIFERFVRPIVDRGKVRA